MPKQYRTCSNVGNCRLPAGHSGVCLFVPMMSMIAPTGEVYRGKGGEHADNPSGPWEPCGNRPTKRYFRVTEWERT